MPASVDVATGNDELTYVGTRTYNSIGDRKSRQDFHGPGVYTVSDWFVSYAGSGLNLQVNAGVAYVRGFNTEQGLYRARQGTNVTTLSVGANASGNPRIDRVILRIYDNDSEAAGAYKATVETIAGTATAGATLDNLNGAADLTALAAPKTYLHLADVLVPDGASSILNSNIMDCRSYAVPTIPALDGSTYDCTVPEPAPGLVYSTHSIDSGYVGKQSAALHWNSRRMVGVTNVRWRYMVDTATLTPSGLSWNIAICNARGRLLGQTGPVAFVRASPNNTVVSQAFLAPFNVECGWIYVWFGMGSITSSGVVHILGVKLDTSAVPGQGPIVPNLAFRMATGASTFGVAPIVNSLLYMIDAVNDTGNAGIPVPQIALSVG